MESGATATINVLRLVVRTVSRRGLEPTPLLDSVGLSADALAPADGRVPRAIELKLWEEAARRVGDPALGLHAAEALEPGDLGVLDYLARTSATLGDAYAKIGRFHRLVHDFFRFSIERRDGVICVHQPVLGCAVESTPICTDFALATLVALGRQMTGVDWAPLEVTFQHGRPTQVDEYQRLFRSPVRFGARRDEVRLPPALLARPLVGADPKLCGVLERYAKELLARLPASGSLRERVKQCLSEELRGGRPTAAHVARRLRVSPRQLQRRLAEEGTSFRELRHALRRSLATSYLEDDRLAIAEVAFLLGFSGSSSFHHAFKRWTGKTPAAFRRR